jgi:glycosyltransferase involved in cell wall biosynthesis
MTQTTASIGTGLLAGYQGGVMRVVFVLPRASRSPIGALKVTYMLADGLAEQGHEVTLVHPGRPGRDEPHPWYGGRADVRSVVAPTLEDTLIEGVHDVVVATSWRIVDKVEAFSPRIGEKVCFLHDYESYRLGSRDERAAMQRSLRMGWPIIAASAPVQDLVHELTGRWCPLVACAVDPRQFRQTHPVDHPARRLIGFPARLERAKRTPDAIAALASVRANRPEAISVWCFGQYPGTLPRWVTHLPAPNDAELCDFYNRTAVFVVPSELEGFGLSGAEAMVCGAALVSTMNGGVAAYARHGESAMLCPPRDPTALARAVGHLLSDDSFRQRMATAGARRVSSRSWRQAIEEFAACLRVVLGQGGSG